MNILTQLIQDDMKPALGVTEPGAIAFAAAKAKSYVSGELVKLELRLNSGMYKNAFSCGIPNSSEVGNQFAAALGYVAGDAEKGLLALEKVTEADNQAAQKLIDAGKVEVSMSGISSDIFIQATISTTEHCCQVTIYDSHTNICEIVLDGKEIFHKDRQNYTTESGQEEAIIHRYTLAQLMDYVSTVPFEEILFIKEAYRVNWELFEESIRNSRTTFAPDLLKQNGGEFISEDALKTAQLLCNGAIEARVIGLDKPAMSITGSGAHGIICTMPLYAYCKVNNLPEELLLRATALSYLVTMYIKEYSGRLSAFCGCAIAAGTGMACGLVFLQNGSVEWMTRTIQNMASSITGMICDGGNQGCAMKGIIAVDAAFRSVELAKNGAYIHSVHGINGVTPEQTMRNMGLIASPGMVATEKTIVEIQQSKN